jgi:RNA recognition motif-containing protein
MPKAGMMSTTVSDMFLQEEYFQQLDLSSTLYIGNLSFYTTEDQVSTCT